MLITKALLWGQKQLQGSVERPRLEAEILLSYMANCKREELILKSTQDIDFQKFKSLIDRRLKSEPIEYIINSVSFYKYNFYVDSGALIPRPESEILVEKAIDIIDKFKIKNVCEIGVGSGALSISIAKSCDVKIKATDISKDALKVAKKNIKEFNLKDKIELFECSLLDCIDEVELLISNPPYIDPNFKLDTNVLNYEPHSALFAPNKGRAILFEILDLIKQKDIKYAICEMGFDQKEPISKYAKELGLDKGLSFYQDLAKLDRGFVFISDTLY